MNYKRVAALILAGSVILPLATISAARAEETLSIAEIHAAVVNANEALTDGLVNNDLDKVLEASGTTEEDVAADPDDVDRKGDGFQADSADGLQINMPEDPQDGIVARGADGGALTVSVPAADNLQEAVLSGDSGTVIYQGTKTTPSVAVQSASGGLRIHTVIASPDSGGSSDYVIDLAEAETIESDVSGFLVIRSADGSPRAYVTPAWAVDAVGRSVPTHYTVSGNVVTQHVDLNDTEIAYPVVADPWMGSNLVDKATWSKSKSGWTFKVTPTGWARSITFIFNLPVSIFAGYAGWDELYARYKNHGLNTNLGGMKDQYVCHLQFAPTKSTWNLDEWRPNVSYPDTVLKLCNP